MELAEAYVTIRADISELKKGLGAARQETEKATSYMDKQASRLTSAFMRMGGGIALIRTSVGALSGAFEQIKAERVFNTAREQGNLNAMVGAYQRANAAGRQWLESIPFVGGAIGRLIQSLQDDSVERFAQMLDYSGQKAKEFAGDIYELARARIALARAQGVAPHIIAGMEAEVSKQEREERLGKGWEAVQTATQATEKTEDAARQAREHYESMRQGVPEERPDTRFPWLKWLPRGRRPVIAPPPALWKVIALEDEAQKARVAEQRVREEFKAAREARPIWEAQERAEMQPKLRMMPAGAGMPPPPGIPTEDVGIKLDRIGATLDKIEAKTGTME